MARIYPFRALRYDTARVKMEDVVTQPYDKITPEMQQRYYEASPYNLVRVIFGKHFSADNDQQNVYTRAAEYLQSWRNNRILDEDSQPALYGYSQIYTVPGTTETRERRGFIALGHLYDYADKVIYRHEQTLPQPKSDRMALFKATRAYCEQIYMLYSDPAFTAERLIFDTTAAPDITVTDEYAVVHRVWKLTDLILINLIVTAMADKKLIIADGHHRYETALAYARERAIQLKLPLNQPLDEDEKLRPGHLPTPAFPEAAMMMTFVNMEAPGITILPTHRVVHGIENFSTPDFITRASFYFNVTELNSPDLAALNATNRTAFLAATPDGFYLLTSKPDIIANALKHLQPRQAQLDVVQLHAIVLERLLGLETDAANSLDDTQHVQYLREANEAIALATSGQANIAFITKPVTLDQLRDISLSNEVMPPKSTDFYPKLLSGLAIYALD